eukprot:826467_1
MASCPNRTSTPAITNTVTNHHRRSSIHWRNHEQITFRSSSIGETIRPHIISSRSILITIQFRSHHVFSNRTNSRSITRSIVFTSSIPLSDGICDQTKHVMTHQMDQKVKRCPAELRQSVHPIKDTMEDNWNNTVKIAIIQPQNVYAHERMDKKQIGELCMRRQKKRNTCTYKIYRPCTM